MDSALGIVRFIFLLGLDLTISLGPAGSKRASPPPFFRNIVVISIFSEIFFVNIFFLEIFLRNIFLEIFLTKYPFGK